MSIRGERPLKDAGSKLIDEAITKAITELAGEEYKADIKTIDFEPSNMAWMSDTVEIKLSLSKVKSWFEETRQLADEAVEEVRSEKEAARNTVANCKLCDARGFRFVKDNYYPNGAARKCSHDPEVEAQIPSYDINNEKPPLSEG